MSVFTWRSAMPASAKELFAWHSRPGAMERLMPPWQRYRMIERTGTGIQDGARIVFEIGLGPFWVRWVALHSGYQEGRQFRDEQIQGPFDAWQHTHRFIPENGDTSWLEDDVSYLPPLSPLSDVVAGRYFASRLERLFRFRHERLLNDIERHHRFSANGSLNIVVSGSSGLVGRRLTNFLSTGGHTVRRLIRPPAPGHVATAGHVAAAGHAAMAARPQDIKWRPDHGELDAAALEGADAVVHLSGENLAEHRWSKKVKAEIRDSRVASTRLIAETVAGMRRKPRVLICASAVGIYGDRGDTAVDERSPAGDGFLAELCQAWEAAADPARQAGIRVVHLRLGMVLARDGGALQRLALPFSLGLGGRIGNGRQAISWMSAEDVVGAINQALFDPRLAGPVNAVAPQPVTNAEFARVLGRMMVRPRLMPLPGVAVKLALGEMGEELLLKGARVHSARLHSVGFPYLFPTLQAALSHELGV